MIGKIVILGIMLGLGYFFMAPQFQYQNTGSNPTTNVGNNPETTQLPFQLPEANPQGIIEWLFGGVEWIGDQLTNFISRYVIENIKKIVPNASDNIIWLALGMVILIIVWLKAESFASIVRTITMVLLALGGIVFVLMILGIV